jgi:uncharacterized MnhB-related membrane protein
VLVARTLIILLVGVFGAVVALTRDPLRQCIVSSFFGLLLTLFFFILRAPDVSLAAITVGSVGLPMMILLALARVRSEE